MIKVGEDELICDLAETYHILDYKSLPVKLVGILSYGLREDSRIKTKIRGGQLVSDNQLLSIACDRLGLLVWAKTKDAAKGKNRPESIHEVLYPEPKSKPDDVIVFDSVEAFENYRKNNIVEKE